MLRGSRRRRSGYAANDSAGVDHHPPERPEGSARPHRRILVTLRVDDQARTLLEKILGGAASLAYLDELSGNRRQSALRSADVLLACNMLGELTHTDWVCLAKRDPAGPALFIQEFLAGLDRVPFANIPRSAIVAGNAGGWAQPMAEYVVGAILALFKRLSVEHHAMQEGAFHDTLPTRGLRGTTCAILGFGHVGQAVASLLTPFGVRILALNTTGTTIHKVAFIGRLADLERVLREADTVVVTMPLTIATRDLIGSRELAWMRDDAVLVNVGRADVVNEDALYQHLSEHREFSAALDVWWDEPPPGGTFRAEHPFLDLPNLIASPHNSGVVDHWFDLGLSHAARNIRRYLLGQHVDGIARREDYVGMSS
jgi:phosphoglycerate dehydrogenase-like enzyme